MALLNFVGGENLEMGVKGLENHRLKVEMHESCRYDDLFTGEEMLSAIMMRSIASDQQLRAVDLRTPGAIIHVQYALVRR